MPQKRPPTSGYARIAQAEEEEEDILEDSEEDDAYRGQSTLSTSGPRYAPIQPKRQSSRMVASGGTPLSSRRNSQGPSRQRSNSGVDIKAINARLERWADEIAQKFKLRRSKGKTEGEEQPEIHHSVFQAPDWIRPATEQELHAERSDESADRITKDQYDEIVDSVRVAIQLGVHPKLISQGSSGSYFAQDRHGRVVGVFKPKDEEPYASRNPKWTKWIHRNLFPFFFGRACLIPNLSYVSEAAAYVLDVQLRTNLVPYTDIVSLSSKSFHYDFWDRRAYYRKKKPFPEKVGSFQYFLKGYKDATKFLKEHPWPDQHSSGFRTDGAPKRKKRRWAEECRPGGAQSDEEDDSDDSHPTSAAESQRRREFWTDTLQQSFREQLEKLVILDYIMRNTDRGLDNWMIKVDTATQEASIVAEAPLGNGHVKSPHSANGSVSRASESDPYKREERMVASSRSATPSNAATSSGKGPSISIGAIDNSLSWPWKHPDAWRSYPFGWLFLPVSLIGQPFSDATRRHFLPLLTSKQWWGETQLALRKVFSQDADFKERMFTRQIAVVKGQAWNVVETLKTPDHGPLELTRRARVCVWDDLVDIPVAVPLRTPSADMRMRHADDHLRTAEDEMDIGAGLRQPSEPQSDLLSLSSPPERPNNPFNVSRQSSSMDVKTGEEASGGPLSPSSVQAISWGSQGRPDHRKTKLTYSTPTEPHAGSRPRFSYDEARRSHVQHTRRSGRLSFSARRSNTPFLVGDDDLEGDLGYAAAEDMEGNQRRVIVERLEMVKSKNPVFTWC